MARNVGPIQVTLPGLYGLLGVKDGSNPDIITGFVQPTIDVTQWWLRATSIVHAEVGAPAFASEVFQPTWGLASQREWLHVHNCFFSATTTAAAASAPVLRILVAQPAPFRTAYSTPLVLGLAHSGVYQTIANAHELWIPPGFQLMFEGLNLDFAPGAAYSIGGQVVQLPI